MDLNLVTTLAPVAGLLALAYAFYRARWIARQDAGTPEMVEIAGAIAEGARAFLRREYRVLVLFVVVVAALLALANANNDASSPLVAASFVVGALCSGLAGFFGMTVATKANVRTTNAARTGLPQALNVAFSGGLVMGLCVVGLGVLGLSLLYLLYNAVMGGDTAPEMGRLLNVISGFSLGASSIALFARVGGGIYTKAADVGADLAGKVYEGIPEDDPRNPATIADNVGDNVGDVAGMGADLFESYVGAIVGTMVLGVSFFGVDAFDGQEAAAIVLPLALSAVGILVSILGAFFVRTKEGGNPQAALNLGEFGAAGLMAVLSYFIIKALLPDAWTLPGGDMSGFTSYTDTGVFFAVVIGLVAGTLIGLVTEHYTATDRRPVLGIARQSLTGSATNIIAGLGNGMMSTAIPTIILAVGIIGAFEFAGLYGIAIAAVGMLSVTGIQLAVDAYGPISDNAGGIAEMAGLPAEVRGRTDRLDAVGNTTAAIGKGFAIGSAALTALALFAAFMQQAGIRTIDVSQPIVLGGLLIGAMLPFVFSALAMGAVGRAAGDMIKEVCRQFREIPGLREGTAKAEYAKCVDISTRAAIREMVLPGLLAIAAPVAIGVLSPDMLAGFLAGVTVSGVLMAIFQSNAGGAWDNAKKQIEAGLTIDGAEYRKGSEAHKAAVVGDTVGDPLKDTSGPSLNILIKLIAVVSLVIAPLLANWDGLIQTRVVGETDTVEEADQPPIPPAPADEDDGASLRPAPAPTLETGAAAEPVAPRPVVPVAIPDGERRP
ncbi:MAG TPA: sodium-translocating pyrophosphatase [Rubricoccaceae bacterium]|nr:sodium-translocating pyrophosphatase [Rubricoccaceae bacterium]